MTTREDILSLAPCPFCGSEAVIERLGDRRQSTIYSCTSCGCSLETGEEWGHGTDWTRRAAPTLPAAEAPGQEPVAWHCVDHITGEVTVILDGEHARRRRDHGGWTVAPLFHAPPTYADAEAKWVTLADCPVGLFLSESGALCLKTEYGDNEGRIDAYIVSSGEFFWGGSGGDRARQRKLLVHPVEPPAIRSLASPAPKGET